MKRSDLKKQIEEIITEFLNEDTIDVSNPSALTPQQKQSLINTAKQSTKDSTLGTAKNPVDFV